LSKTAVAIRHVPFEDAGSLGPILAASGYTLSYVEAWRGDFAAARGADLLIILGGPIGAYEEELYPFLTGELALIAERLAADRPTLGLCLGSQLMARALGANVYPGPGKEIGWSSLALTEAGAARPLGALKDVAVLHWHGDTFDLPDGCERLASTPLYREQAFARGHNLLALQFHPEVTAEGLEAWLVGHAAELAGAGLSPVDLRAATAKAAPKLAAAAQTLFEHWLAGLDNGA
jgi:GMP synthase (glutamine-hydrolysing)